MKRMIRQRTQIGFVVLGLAALAACAADPGPSRAEHEASAAETNALAVALGSATVGRLPPGQVRVRLAFGARADLDLYVTDPSQESVYFANSPSRAGGTLERDMRCDDPAPRVETVTFGAAPAGRYRVGVDFPPAACDGARNPTVFVVVFESHGERQEKRLSIRPGEFLPIVLEADVH